MEGGKIMYFIAKKSSAGELDLVLKKFSVTGSAHCPMRVEAHWSAYDPSAGLLSDEIDGIYFEYVEEAYQFLLVLSSFGEEILKFEIISIEN